MAQAARLRAPRRDVRERTCGEAPDESASDRAEFDEGPSRSRRSRPWRGREKPMLDDAGNGGERGGDALGGVDALEMRVQDVMAAIGQERRAGGASEAELAFGAGALQRRRDGSPRRGKAEPDDLDRSGKRPSSFTRFDPSATTIIRRLAAAMIFSRRSAPPPPLIRRKRVVELVGAVDGQVELRGIVERGQRTPSRSACARSASDVGTPTTRSRPPPARRGRQNALPSSRCRGQAAYRPRRRNRALGSGALELIGAETGIGAELSSSALRRKPERQAGLAPLALGPIASKAPADVIRP